VAAGKTRTRRTTGRGAAATAIDPPPHRPVEVSAWLRQPKASGPRGAGGGAIKPVPCTGAAPGQHTPAERKPSSAAGGRNVLRRFALRSLTLPARLGWLTFDHAQPPPVARRNSFRGVRSLSG